MSAVEGKKKNSSLEVLRAERKSKRDLRFEQMKINVEQEESSKNEIETPEINGVQANDNERLPYSDFAATDTDLQYLRTHDVGIQTFVDDYPRGSIMWDIESDKQISSMIGLESLKLFESIVKMIKMVSKPKSEKTKITIEERVFMTYKKLKHNTPYSY